MSKTVITHNSISAENFALGDYIHIFEEENGSYSVYVTKGSETRSYGKNYSYKAALNKAKEIQKRHRFLILYQDYVGDVKKTYKPKLNAICTGERANTITKRRSSRPRRIAI